MIAFLKQLWLASTPTYTCEATLYGLSVSCLRYQPADRRPYILIEVQEELVSGHR